ncbi:DUF4383 domain-containing protein [Streptomyces pinistramenti]|uniref:DUF4383 domain-containing protein n=1 Tax=Streptomyces pinistramenti TaxID=2884812 RepID=UPI001D08C410|nr:DUF4383 domain-containing protein [Streptomyces pinistramenti]MCB5907062.1 DUF4383 domain-containing protein [Streptomyces pinistramenti]
MATTGATGTPRVGPHGLRGPSNLFRGGKLRHTRLDEHLPTDHRLSKVYRIGAGLMGLALVAFGILGLIDRIGFFDTGGASVAGLNANGSLSVLSIVVGVVLFAGMVIGGNFASTLNTVLGGLFLLSGFVNLALLQTDANFLAFKIQNVLFSFVVGLMLLVFGMYGRVSGGLSHDNPYWRARHPEVVQRMARERMHPATGAAAARQAALDKIQSGATPGEEATPHQGTARGRIEPGGHRGGEGRAGG